MVRQRQRPLCACPEPCACYAEGYAASKDKALLRGRSPASTARPTPRDAPASPAK